MNEFWKRYTKASIRVDYGDLVISTDDFDIFFELYSTGEVEEGKRQEENVETYIELRIYNLSDATYSSINTRQVVISDKDDEEIIVEHGSDITVDSGYMGNDTTLFVGEVVDIGTGHTDKSRHT